MRQGFTYMSTFAVKSWADSLVLLKVAEGADRSVALANVVSCPEAIRAAGLPARRASCSWKRVVNDPIAHPYICCERT